MRLRSGSNSKIMTTLSMQLQHIDLSTPSTDSAAYTSLLNLSTDVLLNLLVTMVDLKSLATFSYTCKYARFIISHTRILEIVAQREWNIWTGAGLGQLAKMRIGLTSFLQLKQWEYRINSSMRFHNSVHKISDQFLFEDGNHANIDELEGSMRIMSPSHFDASINYAISSHEDDSHVYVWMLPACTRVTRFKCEEPPSAIAMYNNRAFTIEKVPLLANESHFRLKLKLWVVPGSGVRQCACIRVLSAPANFPFQIMITIESIVKLNFGGGGSHVVVLSSWSGIGNPFISSYRCVISHILSCETGQLISGPHIVAATYDQSFFNDFIDWRGYKQHGMFRSDDLRLSTSRIDIRYCNLAPGGSSYVVASHILRSPLAGAEDLLQGLWIQEYSYLNHTQLSSLVVIFDPSEFESILLGPIKISEIHFIESDEYKAKHLLVLLDSGHLFEYDLRATEESCCVRSFPSDGNVWNKHQGVVVCMRLIGSTLLTLGLDHSVRMWDLFSGLCCSRAVFPGIKEGFTPVGMQVCRVGIIVASTNNQEDGEDFYGECQLHVVDFNY